MDIPMRDDSVPKDARILLSSVSAPLFGIPLPPPPPPLPTILTRVEEGQKKHTFWHGELERLAIMKRVEFEHAPPSPGPGRLQTPEERAVMVRLAHLALVVLDAGLGRVGVADQVAQPARVSGQHDPVVVEGVLEAVDEHRQRDGAACCTEV